MKKWLKRLQAWRAQRQQISLNRWERTRAKGKARFVVRTALTYGVAVTVAMGILQYLIDNRIEFFTLVGRIIFFSVVGIPIAFSAWSDKETNYKEAHLEARTKPLPPG